MTLGLPPYQLIVGQGRNMRIIAERKSSRPTVIIDPPSGPTVTRLKKLPVRPLNPVKPVYTASSSPGDWKRLADAGELLTGLSTGPSADQYSSPSAVRKWLTHGSSPAPPKAQSMTSRKAHVPSFDATSESSVSFPERSWPSNAASTTHTPPISETIKSISTLSSQIKKVASEAPFPHARRTYSHETIIPAGTQRLSSSPSGGSPPNPFAARARQAIVRRIQRLCMR